MPRHIHTEERLICEMKQASTDLMPQHEEWNQGDGACARELA